MAEEKRKRGGQRKKVDERELYEMAKIHCTMKEMATILGIHVDTLRDNYSNIIEKGREDGRKTLRRAQWQAAMKGNVVMMIWLGKQILQQQDKAQLEVKDEQKLLEVSKEAIKEAIEKDKFIDVVPIKKASNDK